MKTTIIALAALLSLGAAAEAQPILIGGNLMRTSSVPVADLNLAATAGRSTADRRIRGAATLVCANDGDRSLVSLVAAHDCFRDAIDGAKKQLEAASTVSF